MLAVAFHLADHIVGRLDPADEDGRQQGDERHHEPRDLFNAALHAVVDDQRRDGHEKEGKDDRGDRRGDKVGKIAVLRGGLCLPGQVDHGILRDPAADDRVVGHDQHRHEEGQDAEEFPLRVQLGVRADGAFVRPAADGNVGGQQREAERQHQHEVDQQEQPAAVLRREIGEAPEIPDADCAPGSREHEAELPGKMIRFLFHDVQRFSLM